MNSKRPVSASAKLEMSAIIASAQANTVTKQHELIVLYDGECPICRREIAFYRWLDRHQRVAWLDITTSGPRLQSLGITANEAMAVFHVIDQRNHVTQGVTAFLTLWRVLPGFRWLAATVSLLGLQPGLEWGYKHFLRWRATRERCSTDKCK